MDIEKLELFLTFAKRACVRKEAPMEEEIIEGVRHRQVQNGNWRYHEMYTGTARVYGFTMVYYKNQVCWSMVTAGGLIMGAAAAGQERTITAFHQEGLKALTSTNSNPPLFRRGAHVLRLTLEGDIELFTGTEVVTIHDREVFRLNHRGGLIR